MAAKLRIIIFTLILYVSTVTCVMEMDTIENTETEEKLIRQTLLLNEEDQKLQCTNDGFDQAYTNFILFLIRVTDVVIKPVPLKLRWASASLDPSDCATYNINIRYHCVNQGFESETEMAKYLELCDELIPKGLKKHIERDNLEIHGKVYKLRIHSTKTDVDADNSQKVILANDCYVRSNNHVVVPLIMGYCRHSDPDVQSEEDLRFMSTIVHELGHDILFVGEGIYESRMHKGSSSFWQNVIDDGPVANCTTDEEFDVMFYYRDVDDSCYNVTMNEDGTEKWQTLDSYYEKKMLSKRDATHLVQKALQEDIPTSCALIH